MTDNIDDLIAKAKAAFDALPPEEQALMLAEQRIRFAAANVALSRPETVTTLAPTNDMPLREQFDEERK